MKKPGKLATSGVLVSVLAGSLATSAFGASVVCTRGSAPPFAPASVGIVSVASSTAGVTGWISPRSDAKSSFSRTRPTRVAASGVVPTGPAAVGKFVGRSTVLPVGASRVLCSCRVRLGRHIHCLVPFASNLKPSCCRCEQGE